MRKGRVNPEVTNTLVVGENGVRIHLVKVSSFSGVWIIVEHVEFELSSGDYF